ncbi:DUF7565 family protein [Halanaeroarchaeum sulfurireducens]|uniref:C2H2-type domain-containing protein n=1 Tax=Halanaeroarchaeum sulfurireducens TaxID=1604004 RepID=A0A0F7PAH6_9EURY|nr:hypothetical protein [Halanaeroarchaeum sulfurireducens]AKH97165.1 hypothetical protein HLASF_0669 [Halanaeroarchaeum sulfurireducens]ALG81566.1 hypothetical protein HLASA_0665 [Halanaeroarchaeum sulfurireducens]
MDSWTCAIGDCAASFDDLEALVAHQVTTHEPHRCRICDEIVPEGFFAIRHAVEEHSRAEYVRHYDADSDAIRLRESVVERVSDAIDVEALQRRLDAAEPDRPRAEVIE